MHDDEVHEIQPAESGAGAAVKPAPRGRAPAVSPPPDAPQGHAPESALRTPSAKPRSRILHGRVSTGVAWFGLPLVVAMALQAMFNLVDMFIVGQLPEGTEALAALAICDLVAMVASIVANGVSNATVAIIARRRGEGDDRAISTTSAQAMGLTLALSIVFGAIGLLLAEPLTADVFGAKGPVQEMAAEYMRIIVGGSFTVLVLFQITAMMRAVGDSVTPMVLLVGANVLNLFLSVTMVYGPGPAPELFAWGPPLAEALDLPRMGVAGAAWSTLWSRGLAIVLGFALLFAAHRDLRFSPLAMWPRAADVRRLVRIAWPSSAQFVLRILVILFFTALIGHHFTTAEDSTVLTAYGICIRLDTVALFTGMGWGAAASTWVGQNLGALRPGRANTAAWVAALYNALVMIGVLAIYRAWAPAIVGLFDDDPRVVATGVEYLGVVGLSYAFLGVAVVLSQALAGAGATLSSLVLDSLVLLGLVIPITLLTVLLSDVTPERTWLLIALGNVLSGIAYALWFATKRWVHKQV